ncbi:MAG: DUF4347 domain-containing protein [Pegethrix bostrychoides GSE-TBD4-15B]|jgi:hypothetical protein|uniref:DUF4347 domain-containing protein n=1 Tax=Pegethrix bostrychoides GSE-TBD4-15B TaxID=2839662 RepID=A0A951U302_9CYAN|nr:DUF4347 domain-containing protein [Pegethrix bostrychoides GSE-TBD4-15B]
MPVNPVSGREIAFIDMSVQQYATLAAGVRAGVEMLVLNAQQDGVEQITQVLRKRRDLSCIHLISPGTVSSFQLGNTALSLNTLERYVWDLTIWSNALGSDAELLIYGSEVAKGVRGEEFVGHLSELTSARVAASRSKTGGLLTGGNWKLEVQTLPCQTALAFNLETMAAYETLL